MKKVLFIIAAIAFSNCSVPEDVQDTAVLNEKKEVLTKAEWNAMSVQQKNNSNCCDGPNNRICYPCIDGRD